MRCAESLRVQAYFDGEVDAVSAADLERHAEHCAQCRALLEDLERVRTVLRRDTPYERTPAALRASLRSALDRESAAGPESSAAGERLRGVGVPGRGPSRPSWIPALAGAGTAALAAVLAFVLLVPRLTDPLLDELANAHARSLMPEHLIDVASTDKHTVKPWFAGHADVSPAVADFASQGYRLVGGRADYLEHQRAAVVVYQHGSHIINVFSWAAGPRALPANVTRNGYRFVFWRSADLDYCAVSDTGREELSGLVSLLQGIETGGAG